MTDPSGDVVPIRSGAERLPAVRDAITRHDARLRRHVARKMSSGVDREDIVQEVYLRLSRIADLQPDVTFTVAYLIMTANSVMNDLHRRGRRRLSNLHVEIQEGTVEVRETPFTFLSWRQDADLIANFVNALPERQRQVLILSRVNEMSLKEISRELRIPLRTVQRLLADALLSCRSYLRELGCFGQG